LLIVNNKDFHGLRVKCIHTQYMNVMAIFLNFKANI